MRDQGNHAFERRPALSFRRASCRRFSERPPHSRFLGNIPRQDESGTPFLIATPKRLKIGANARKHGTEVSSNRYKIRGVAKRGWRQLNANYASSRPRTRCAPRSRPRRLLHLRRSWELPRRNCPAGDSSAPSLAETGRASLYPRTSRSDR